MHFTSISVFLVETGTLRSSSALPSFGTYEVPSVEHIRPFHITPYGGEDLWKDAKMEEVLEYLAGGLSLDLPEEWQDSFPVR